MEQEIERKFLVAGDSWRKDAGGGISCRQGYISAGPSPVTVRVRLLGGQGFLTIKGPTQGVSRTEMEYEIPAADAEHMLEHFCAGSLVEKTRYIVVYNGMRWEIDEFSEANTGLVVAEIELEQEDQLFEKPVWLGEEVSLDRRYTNVALARHPFARW